MSAQPASTGRNLLIRSEEDDIPLVGSWVWAAAWCGIAFPITLMFALDRQIAGLLLGCVFSALGMYFLAKVARLTGQWRKFGEVRIVVKSGLPAAGSELTGQILLTRGAGAAKSICAQLRCFELIPATDGGDPPLRRKLWKGGEQVFAVSRVAAGMMADFSFKVPAEKQMSAEAARFAWTPFMRDDAIGHVWEIAVRADLPGLDLARTFVLPPGTYPALKAAARL